MHLESSEIKLTLSIENDKSFTIQPIFFFKYNICIYTQPTVIEWVFQWLELRYMYIQYHRGKMGSKFCDIFFF